MSLRSATIRLAHLRPHLRPHLLPLLTKSAAQEGTILLEGDKIRVTEGRNAIIIQELPSKPVKRQLRQIIYSTYELSRQFRHSFEMDDILQNANLSKSMDFDGANAAMALSLQAAQEQAFIDAQEFDERNPDRSGMVTFTTRFFQRNPLPKAAIVREGTISFLEVPPANYKPVSFRGIDFGGTAEWNEFTFAADSDEDEFMSEIENMRAYYSSTSPGAARKLFNLLKVEPKIFNQKTVEEFKEFLEQYKISFQYNPTVFR